MRQKLCFYPASSGFGLEIISESREIYLKNEALYNFFSCRILGEI